MFQVVLVFLFAATLAWLVAESPALIKRIRHIEDREWTIWLDELRREHRR